MPSTMEQPSFLPPEKPKRSEFVEPKMPQPAEVVDMGEFIARTPSATEEIVHCGECNTPRPKGQRKCPGCSVFGK